MIYALSDIHGHYNIFEERINQLKISLEETGRLLCLVCDEEEQKYYQLDESGHPKKV